MGQYEPDDSRNVTLKPGNEPGNIKRTGPQEDEARAEARKREAEKAKKDEADSEDVAALRARKDPAERG